MSEGEIRVASGAARGQNFWHSDWTARVRAGIFWPKNPENILERIPLLEDLQSSWLLLLMCGATRANFWLRTVRTWQNPSQCSTMQECGSTCSISSASWTLHQRLRPLLSCRSG